MLLPVYINETYRRFRCKDGGPSCTRVVTSDGYPLMYSDKTTTTIAHNSDAVNAVQIQLNKQIKLRNKEQSSSTIISSTILSALSTTHLSFVK